jgi:hypothetical protein
MASFGEEPNANSDDDDDDRFVFEKCLHEFESFLSRVAAFGIFLEFISRCQLNFGVYVVYT